MAAEQRSGSEGCSRRESLRLSADRLHPGAQRLCSQRLPLPERVSQGEFRVQMSISALLAVNRFCGFHVFFRPTI